MLASPAPDSQPLETWPECRKQGWQQRGGNERGRTDDEESTGRNRSQLRRGNYEERRKADYDGGGRDGDSVPRVQTSVFRGARGIAPHRACLDPRAGFEEGARAVLETPFGRCPIEVAVDGSVPPGVVLVSGSPEIADIRGADGRARVVRV